MEAENKDILLLQRYAENGDAEAFSKIVGRYQEFVYSACLRVLGNAADAEDMAQDCFLRLARGAGKITSSPGGWLHHCAVDMSLNEKRRQAARKRREEVHNQMKASSNNEPDWDEISPHVDEALDELPDELRVVLIEHFLCRRTQAELAEEQGVSASTISRRVEAGLEELRKKLRKAGVIVSAALLASLVAENAVIAAPATLTAALGKMAIAGVNSGAAAGWTGTGVAAGAMTLAAKVKIAAVVVAAFAVGGVVAREMVGERGDGPEVTAEREEEEIAQGHAVLSKLRKFDAMVLNNVTIEAQVLEPRIPERSDSERLQRTIRITVKDGVWACRSVTSKDMEDPKYRVPRGAVTQPSAYGSRKLRPC